MPSTTTQTPCFDAGFHETCWVCGARLVTAVPPGGAECEDHHVVPRAYGGTNGPVVSLCASCHSKLHRLAKQLPTPDTNLIPRDKQEASRLLFLANVAYNAEKQVKTDPNKLVMLQFRITKDEAALADSLKPLFHVRSRSEVYKRAVALIANQLKQR